MRPGLATKFLGLLLEPVCLLFISHDMHCTHFDQMLHTYITIVSLVLVANCIQYVSGLCEMCKVQIKSETAIKSAHCVTLIWSHFAQASCYLYINQLPLICMD